VEKVTLVIVGRFAEAVLANAGMAAKSAASDAVVPINADTAAVLRAWRRTQLAERLAFGEHWTDPAGFHARGRNAG